MQITSVTIDTDNGVIELSSEAVGLLQQMFSIRQGCYSYFPPPANLATTIVVARQDMENRIDREHGSGIYNDCRCFLEKKPVVKTITVSWQDEDGMTTEGDVSEKCLDHLASMGSMAASHENFVPAWHDPRELEFLIAEAIQTFIARRSRLELQSPLDPGIEFPEG